MKRVQVVNRIEHVGEEGLDEQDRLHPAFGGILFDTTFFTFIFATLPVVRQRASVLHTCH